MTTRDKVNRSFYGRGLTAKQLLLGDLASAPMAAKPLYGALEDLLARAELPVSVEGSSRLHHSGLADSPHSACQESEHHTASDRGRRLQRADESTVSRRGRSITTGAAEGSPPNHWQVQGAIDLYGSDIDEDGGAMMGHMIAE
jgi:hypothetical protein